MSDEQENSGLPLGDVFVAWMVENRPALDERMKEEGSKALIQEFMAAEGGQGLPTPEERLDRARQASAHAWLRHLAAAIQANWQSAPAGFAASMEKWLTAGPFRDLPRSEKRAGAAKGTGSDGKTPAEAPFPRCTSRHCPPDAEQSMAIRQSSSRQR